MGLAISVGNPAAGDKEGEEHFRAEYRRLAEALATHGIDWSEPDAPPPPDAMRSHAGSFPYSYLARLRLAYALFATGQPVTPVADADVQDAYDRHVDTDSAVTDASHLLTHADNEGYYVPAKFAEPLLLSPDVVAGSGMVGSSHALFDELIAVAPALGVRLEPNGSLSDAEAERLVGNEGDPFESEQTAWLTLHEACRASMAYGNAIVFC